MKTTLRSAFAMLLLFTASGLLAKPAPEKRAYYEIKLYRLTNNEQVQRVDEFLKNAYLPALHRAGFAKVGVYHWIGNDTSADKRVYVFIPLQSLESINTVEELLVKDKQLQQDGNAYWNAEFNNPVYKRVENIIIKAFPLMPNFQAPNLSGNKTDRVYELRSYEGGTERLYRQKVKMFNEGGEIALFKRLNFNAVFYGEVIAGSHMPNLMYMTSFNDMADRDAHWKTFGADPEWNRLKALPEYLNTVSLNDTRLLHPTEFSDL
jgi:hypothetical protein